MLRDLHDLPLAFCSLQDYLQIVGFLCHHNCYLIYPARLHRGPWNPLLPQLRKGFARIPYVSSRCRCGKCVLLAPSFMFPVQMSDKPEGADFDPVGLLDHSEKQPDQSLPQASFHAPVSHEQGDSEWLTAQALPQPPSAAQGSQSIFRTLPEPPQTTSSNPFDSDKDSLYDFHLPKSVWSANTSDIDTRSFRTFTSSESTATATHTFLLQPPPRSVIPQPHPRIPSFNGTVASLVPFEGMPVLPLTPMSFRRSGSSKSITPYPVGSVRSSHGARSNSRSSVSSSSSISSLGSTQRSPFALTPVTLSHTDTSTRRDSGYPTSSDRSSFYAQSEGGLYVVNGSVRQSVGSSVSGEYQVAGPPGRRGTFGV